MNKWLRNNWGIGALCAAGITAMPTMARAGVFQDVLTGMDALQFQFIGGDNPLSDGFNGTAIRTFQGETLDFGATELSLSGPLQIEFDIGRNGFLTTDFRVTTLDQPFQYLMISDTGGQETTVAGSFDLEANISFNQFGFYDVEYHLFSRQDITQDGRFATSELDEQDFDMGPVNVSGNIFADILAVIFDPFFESAGTFNVFESFSGRIAPEVTLHDPTMPASGGTDRITAEALSSFLARAAADQGPSTAYPSLTQFGTSPASGPYSIPEPSSLGLLVAGTALSQFRRRRG